MRLVNMGLLVDGTRGGLRRREVIMGLMRLCYLEKWAEGWQLWILNGLIVLYLDKPITVRKQRFLRLGFMMWPTRTEWFRHWYWFRSLGGLLFDIRTSQTGRYGTWIALPFFRLLYLMLRWKHRHSK